jgi:hypothetical protein
MALGALQNPISGLRGRTSALTAPTQTGHPKFDTNRRKCLIHIDQAVGIATTAGVTGCRRWVS